MHDDELKSDILLRLKAETPYLPDNGFADNVIRSLPLRSKLRIQVIGLSWTLALITGVAIWVLSRTSFSLFAIHPSLVWSAAAIGLWLFLGLFAFLIFEEGVFET